MNFGNSGVSTVVRGKQLMIITPWWNDEEVFTVHAQRIA